MTREELKLSVEQFINMLGLLDDFLDKYDEEVGLAFCDVDYGIAIEQLEDVLQYITANSIQLRTIYNKRGPLKKDSDGVYRIKDCLSCSNSHSEETINGDLLHCMADPNECVVPTYGWCPEWN